MALHPLAEHFAAVAQEYERGRPDYEPAVVGALTAELGVSPGGPILDLAAGTGKLTRALVGGGFDVTAVEPQASLRTILADRVGAERVQEGLAEAIPLPDDSVEAVTVADSFHWFDRPRALQEIGRVLGPGGGLALLNTRPDWRSATWCDEFVRLLVEDRVEHPNFDGRPWREYVREAAGWGEPWEIRVTTYPLADTGRLLDQMASMSWIAAMPHEQRAERLGRARELLESGQTPERMPLHVEIGLARVEPRTP
ncbi:MAG: methyltransferase domain-containing protein [Solirubrobacteraceae bacterium]